MMNVKELKSKHKAICEKLADKKVKDALDLIQILVKETHNADMIDAHYNLEFTYKNILRYTVEGISDPERQKIYNHLIKDVYMLSDRIFNHLMVKFSGDKVSELQREFENHTFINILEELGEIWSSVELKKVLDKDAENSSEVLEWGIKAFQYIWSSAEIMPDEKEALVEFYRDSSYPWYLKAWLLAAINLSLMHRFSSEYIRLLMDLMLSKNDQIRARAITSLIIVFSKYDNRLPLYSDLYTRFFMQIEENKMETLVQSIVIQLIRTQETEKISQKLHDEILPEVVKMQPKLKEKLDLENMLGENRMDDMNPEWDEIFKDSPNLISKMEELTQWQMEGADVFLSTFQHLKHFTFFNNVANWLLPFYPEHPELQNALQNEESVFKNESLLSGLAGSRFLCNSDKYSLMLSIPHMPSMQKDLMGQMFSAELEQMAEIAKDEEALNANQGVLVASNQYIQDLYRLLKVHPQRHLLEDVFSQHMDLHKKWFFKQLLGDVGSLREIGEYYFKKSYYEDAIDVFELLMAKNANQQDIIQKIAFCYQKLKQFKKALNLYQRADFLYEASVWNKKKIAFCFRHLKQPDKALEYYKEAESIDPENLQTQASIGHCYLELENFEEALKYYFKVEYLAPDNNKVGRPIAWCSFVLGKFDQAEKYYHKLLVTEKNKHDLINLGHTLWCKKLRKDALASYQKSIKLPNHSFSEFLETFNEDLPHLKKHGIEAQDIPLMLDQIRYSLEN